jgi:hypothetical protein
MANIYEPETWSQFPQEVQNKLYAVRELLINQDKQDSPIQEEPDYGV